jgi:hypothetical protein
MSADLPALFGLPEPAPQTPPVTDAEPGRVRQTYRRTVTADIQIVRPAVLHQAALDAIDHCVTIDLGPTDDDSDLLDPQEEAATDVGALTWAVDPTCGLHDLLRTGAIALTDVTLDATDASPGRCRITWSTAIKLKDVPALHRHARKAWSNGTTPDVDDGDIGRTIGQSLAAAWNLAADPYAPLRGVPGIAWAPGTVAIEQVFARPARHR